MHCKVKAKFQTVDESTLRQPRLSLKRTGICSAGEFYLCTNKSPAVHFVFAIVYTTLTVGFCPFGAVAVPLSANMRCVTMILLVALLAQSTPSIHAGTRYYYIYIVLTLVSSLRCDYVNRDVVRRIPGGSKNQRENMLSLCV